MAKKGRTPKGKQKELQPQLDLGEPEEQEEEEAVAAAEAAEDEGGPDAEEGHSGNGVAKDDAGIIEDGEVAASAEAEVEDTGPKLTRLVNTKDGCWKELDDGSKVDLDEDEWRAELARSFGRATGA